MCNLELAMKIRNLRKARAWSQAHLSEAAAVSLRTIQRVERSGTCSQDTLLSLAAAFDVDVSLLASLHRSGQKAPLMSVGVAWMWQAVQSRLARWLITAAAALTALACVAMAGGQLSRAAELDWIAIARLTICLLVAAAGLFIVVMLDRVRLTTPLGWITLADCFGLLICGAAGLVWTYHIGYISGDFEYWIMLLELILAGQGVLAILYLLARHLPISAH